MGMYDTFVIARNNQLNIPVADDAGASDDGTYQSKYFDCNLDRYLISETGRIDRVCSTSGRVLNEPFTADFEMYSSAANGKWIDLRIIAVDNQIVEISDFYGVIWQKEKPKPAYQMKASLAAAIDAGVDMSKRGKEWYSLWIHGDSYMNFIEHQIMTRYPDLWEQHHISVAGVCIWLIGRGTSILQVSENQRDVLYIHKKRFKRQLKKAVLRSLNKVKS